MKKSSISRREFIGRAAGIGAAGFAVPYIIPASALGLEAGKPAANSRIQLGLIGCNGMGAGNLKN